MFQQFISRVQDSIQQISSYAQPVDNLVRKSKVRSRHAHVIHMLDIWCTLSARAPKRAHCEPPQRRARWVAVAIGIALSIPMAVADGGSIDATKTVKDLAAFQLTDEQYDCHNSIIYRESRWNIDAVNGSHYGYYQGHSNVLIDAPYDYQFYWYWHYVSNRYGITEYDEPDYCKALHHLRVKGWQ